VRPAGGLSGRRITAAALLLALAGCDGGAGGGEGAPDAATSTASTASTAPAGQAESAAPAALPALTPPKNRVKTPFPGQASPDLEASLVLLGETVDVHAADPDNPWAVAHGLVARGAGFTLSNGEPAVEAMFERFAFEQELAGKTLIGFPRKRGAIRIEPHTDLLLKAMTEAGVDPALAVQVEGRPHTVGDLWGHSLMTTWLNLGNGESSYDSPNDMPWGIQGLAAWAPPDLQWQAWQGTPMSMKDMTRLMVHVLHTESGFLLEAMEAGGDFQKRGQGIFQYTCGGAHLLQGSAFVVARGFGGEEEREKLRQQGRLLYYRFPRELAITTDSAAQRPDMALILMVQQLKFVGHWLESAHKLAASGLYTPDSAEQLVMAQALGALVDTIAALKRLGAYDNLDTIREQNEQLYLDLVGDSAHALRGAELALGRAEYAY